MIPVNLAECYQNVTSYLEIIRERMALTDIPTFQKKDKEHFHKDLNDDFRPCQLRIEDIAQRMKELAASPQVSEEEVDSLNNEFVVLKEKLDSTYQTAPPDKVVEFTLWKKSTYEKEWVQLLPGATIQRGEMLAYKVTNTLGVDIIALISNIYPKATLAKWAQDLEADPMPMDINGNKSVRLVAEQQANEPQIDATQWERYGYQYQPFLKEGQESNNMVLSYCLPDQDPHKWYSVRCPYVLKV